MFSLRLHKENAELTGRFSISENVRLIQDLPGIHRLHGKIDGERGFCCRAHGNVKLAIQSAPNGKVNTVKPVYNGHPWEMARCPLYTV